MRLQVHQMNGAVPHLLCFQDGDATPRREPWNDDPGDRIWRDAYDDSGTNERSFVLSVKLMLEIVLGPMTS